MECVKMDCQIVAIYVLEKLYCIGAGIEEIGCEPVHNFNTKVHSVFFGIIT